MKQKTVRIVQNNSGVSYFQVISLWMYYNTMMPLSQLITNSDIVNPTLCMDFLSLWFMAFSFFQGPDWNTTGHSLIWSLWYPLCCSTWLNSCRVQSVFSAVACPSVVLLVLCLQREAFQRLLWTEPLPFSFLLAHAVHVTCHRPC